MQLLLAICIAYAMTALTAHFAKSWHITWGLQKVGRRCNTLCWQRFLTVLDRNSSCLVRYVVRLSGVHQLYSQRVVVVFFVVGFPQVEVDFWGRPSEVGFPACVTRLNESSRPLDVMLAVHPCLASPRLVHARLRVGVFYHLTKDTRGENESS